MLSILGSIALTEQSSAFAHRNTKRGQSSSAAHHDPVSEPDPDLVCREIDVYGIDSHVSRFAVDTGQARIGLLERIDPFRVFAQNNLVIKGDTTTTIFPTAEVVRLDLIMNGYPAWPFHHHISDIVEITAAELRDRMSPLNSDLCKDNTHEELIHVFADVILANAERIFVQCELHCSLLKEATPWNMTPLDNSLMVQHILAEPSLYIRRRSGGAILLNTAHVVRLNLHYAPTNIPNAWPGNLL